MTAEEWRLISISMTTIAGTATGAFIGMKIAYWWCERQRPKWSAEWLKKWRKENGLDAKPMVEVFPEGWLKEAYKDPVTGCTKYRSIQRSEGINPTGELSTATDAELVAAWQTVREKLQRLECVNNRLKRVVNRKFGHIHGTETTTTG